MQQSTAIQHAADVLRFVRGIDMPSSRNAVLNSAIVKSWRRCLEDYALDPASVHPAPVVDAHVLKDLREQHAELVQIASAEIDWLYEHIAGSGYALLLTDASGIILYEKSDPTLARTFHSAGLLVGADWSEPSQGTNGMGTCIAEQRAVTVHLDEHFHGCHIGLSCSAAPIRDPSGSLLAVLDASTMDARDTRVSQAHTMALVNLSARLIEKCVFLRHFRETTVLRFHARPELVNLQHDGALALSGDATIISADGTALRLLGARDRNELIGRRIEEVFDLRYDDILAAQSASRGGLLTVRDTFLGRRFFASVGQDTVAARPMTHVTRSLAPQSVLQVAASARKTTLELEELAGDDPQMLRNVRSARRVASSQVPVMIQGPTGAGKEAFARALHAASGRADKPFVALNCAAIPESLIESELFGYRPGAFTGARKEGMKGKILQSSGGTLFLDEIGDMPLQLQTRLLRVLEEQEVVPLGAETPVKVDLRVICASHQNLRAMIARGTFREDLYYRLNGITFELPPLAQRKDKERLIRDFLAAETSDGRPAAIEMDAFQCLLSYAWPGNIRELRNVIRTALAICDGGVVRLSDLPSEVREHVSAKSTPAPETSARPSPDDQTSAQSAATPAGAFEAAEREVLLRAIRECGGNMSHAAKALGISRNTLYRRCKRVGLAVQRHRPAFLS